MPESSLGKAAVIGQAGVKGPTTLLYIEDTLSNLEVVKLVIDHLRPAWRLLAAQDGHSGLQQAREQIPDFILLNVHLPGMSADAVLASLRGRTETSQIPVLMISGDAALPTRKRLLALGADDYVLKPFNVRALVHKIESLMRGGKGERKARSDEHFC